MQENMDKLKKIQKCESVVWGIVREEEYDDDDDEIGGWY